MDDPCCSLILKVVWVAARKVMAFDLDMVSISCVAPMSPVVKFATRTPPLRGCLNHGLNFTGPMRSRQG